MRVAIVGATGNIGSALLEELSERPEVSSVLGIARRLPENDAAPYSHAEWATTDIQFPESVEALSELFTGVDAVIHLAWLIQPNTKRELLRRVNVDGTKHVLEAAAAAGVQRISVASSVGAYSPVSDDQPRDESWGTEGIPGSHYSQDKAAQERVMDEFQALHPETALSRMRPGLIFQAAAGAEIQRYFAGSLAPVQILNRVRPPIIPFPQGVRTQAVHSRDVAAAFATAVIQGARGAFNLAADDLLTAEIIARVVTGRDSGRSSVTIPLGAVKPLVKLAHRAHLLPMDEGWLQMAQQVPVLDTTRARTELGWQPTVSAEEALAEIIEGMSSGAGRGSAPMRPRGESAHSGHPLPGADHRIPEGIDTVLLRQYMADHLAGATAGAERIAAMADAFIDTPVYPQLAQVAETIGAERSWFSQLMQRQGFPRPGVAAPLFWAGEKLARLKPYARPPLKRSPSALVLETELMIAAITAKRQGWEVLSDYAEEVGVPFHVFHDLISAADEQREMLDEVHTYARRRAFRTDRETLTPQL
ncbi:NAD-dependent epimerase/dehydratase family protein [Nesterenkonia ebinurensis]|uniref:NAD-dependent epimerase/dehydratase family protein n=1 Tax=Nesterenkonia ebinurensis TaxID=2608252 RepID=UPI00123DBEE4|nr:NAD-dependent epimerase/dehydratase family protein [Nesterenkonia ebinurensis]